MITFSVWQFVFFFLINSVDGNYHLKFIPEDKFGFNIVSY